MALRVEVAGYGLCQHGSPHALFIICVQQEKFEAWTVYRRFHSFLMLREQLAAHHPGIPSVPGVDVSNLNHDYLEQARAVLDYWLQGLASNTFLLRLQPMYQFLCIDANMPPPYLEVHMSGASAPAEEEMDMDEMFDGDEEDDRFDEDDHDDDDVASPEHVFHKAAAAAGGAGGKPPHRRPSANSPHGHNKKRGLNSAPAPEDDGMDIQSLSFVQAELTYDKKDEGLRQSKSRRIISLESFKIIKVIGKGSFGKVFLVREKQSGQLYAMKVLKKDYILRKNQVEHTKTERSVLGYIHHPFIVGLNMAFQTADKLFFVLDYCSGGELFFHLGKVGQFVEERAKFYAAQITLALEYVHQRGVIYRDLKPENVLLDQAGNVRLTDFGLSKEGISDHSSGANSFCGTPEYIAPEVLLRQGHGRAVDWWSLGALLYEMITGLPPFYSRNRETMFEKIKNADLTFPAHVSENARNLLSRLLVRDPSQRLGSGEEDAEELKRHPFFQDVNWPALATGKLPPPWVPRIAGSLDTSQFDQEFTSMLPVVSPDVRDAYFGSLDKAFEGFTFVDETAAQHMASHTNTSTSTSGSRSGTSLALAASYGTRKVSSSASTAAMMAHAKKPF